jgi:hypothetical protein
MKKIIFLLFAPVILMTFLTFTPVVSIARADGPVDINSQQGFGNGGEISTAFGSSDNPTDPRTIVSNIIKVALGLLGIIFIVLLIYAGFKYMTSQGNEEQVDSAKKQIVSAIIGLIIILSAYGITVFVTKAIINATK